MHGIGRNRENKGSQSSDARTGLAHKRDEDIDAKAIVKMLCKRLHVPSAKDLKTLVENGQIVRKPKTNRQEPGRPHFLTHIFEAAVGCEVNIPKTLLYWLERDQFRGIEQIDRSVKETGRGPITDERCAEWYLRATLMPIFDIPQDAIEDLIKGVMHAYKHRRERALRAEIAWPESEHDFVDEQWAMYEKDVRPDLYSLLREYLSRCRAGGDCTNYFRHALDLYGGRVCLAQALSTAPDKLKFCKKPDEVFSQLSYYGQMAFYWPGRRGVRLVDKWDQFSGAPLHAYEEFQEPDNQFGTRWEEMGLDCPSEEERWHHRSEFYQLCCDYVPGSEC